MQSRCVIPYGLALSDAELPRVSPWAQDSLQETDQYAVWFQRKDGVLPVWVGYTLSYRMVFRYLATIRDAHRPNW